MSKAVIFLQPGLEECEAFCVWICCAVPVWR